MYDSDVSSVMTALHDANPAVFSDATIANILALSTKPNDTTVTFTNTSPDANGNVTVASGTDVVLVASSDTFTTTVHAPANAPVVIFQGKGGVIATINDAAASVPSANQSHVDRVVVGSAGNDNIIVTDAKNTSIILGTGNSTVQTGHGVDTVQAGLGNSTIIGGAGDYAVVKLAGNASNYQVVAQNGHAIVTDMTTHKTTDISKIQYVQLDHGNALVFAKDSVEGQVASLYHVAFGREADAGGLDYWFDLAKGGASLKQIAYAFVLSTEYTSTHSNQSDTAFIQSLYQNTFGRAGEDSGVAYWQDALAHGATKADVIANFSEIAVQNIMHTAPQQEAQIVGSVMIVTGII
jgi:Ca2+-binding RTX toxin-like protein